jgi:hypothetical protein
MSANQHSVTTEQHEPWATEDVQEGKLELVVEVAAAVW